MTTTDNPHPLKGIVNTNDDPTRCAGCHLCIDWYDENGIIILTCCGKTLCTACDDEEGYSMASGKPLRCIFCREPATLGLSLKEVVSRTKKNAKRRHAWAQLALGRIYSGGRLSVSQSTFEAKRWFEKAAKQNHPVAYFELASIFYDQYFRSKPLGMAEEGSSQDALSNARHYADMALSADISQSSPFVIHMCHLLLVSVAKKYFAEAFVYKEQLGDKNRHAKLMLSIEILEPIATNERKRNRDLYDSQYSLGRSYHAIGNFTASRKWCLSSFLANDDNGEYLPSIGVLVSCANLELLAQVKVWIGIVSAIPFPLSLTNDERGNCVMNLVQAKRDLRKIRGFCGFCGSSFSTGVERKLCSGCRALCYCSRDCQKMHWNRKKDGHREDCKGAVELKQKLKKGKAEAAMKNDT